MISCLNNRPSPIVIDTCVAINVAGSQVADKILRTIPNQVLITQTALSEMLRGQPNGWGHAEVIQECLNQNLIECVDLDDKSIRTFEQLVIGKAVDTLDDGEAATIAYCSSNAAISLTDDQKAINILSSRFPDIEFGHSADIFSHENILKSFSEDQLIEAVLNALHKTRMRVLPRHMDWLIELLRSQNLENCHSLPSAIRRTLLADN